MTFSILNKAKWVLLTLHWLSSTLLLAETPQLEPLLKNRSTTVRASAARLLGEVEINPESQQKILALYNKAFLDQKYAVRRQAHLSFQRYLDKNENPIGKMIEILNSPENRNIINMYLKDRFIDRQYTNYGETVDKIKVMTVFRKIFSNLPEILHDDSGEEKRQLIFLFICYSRKIHLSSDEVKSVFASILNYLPRVVNPRAYPELSEMYFQNLASPEMNQAISQEGECSEFRLDHAPGAFTWIPNRTQSAENCYAETAVDLIDAWRFSHPNIDKDFDHQFHSSPLAASVDTKASNLITMYSQSDPLYFLSRGYIDVTLRKLIKSGACDANSDPERMDFIRLAHAFYHERDKDRWKGDSFAGSLSSIVERTCQKYGYGEKEQALLSNLEEAAKVLSFKKFVQKGACDQRKDLSYIPMPKHFKFIRGYRLGTDYSLNKVLKKAFNPKSGPIQPVGVVYCLEIFEKKREEMNWLSSIPRACKLHSSTIIGRRYHHGKWQLLLHTLGVDCRFFGSHLDCEKSGSAWVDQDYLSTYTFSATYIPN